MFRKQPQAFIALPYGARTGELRDAIEDTLHRHEVVPLFADSVEPGTRWATAIQEVLREADLVIADVTGSSPNVMIEVGMALGMSKPLVLLSQSRSADLPADLRAHQVALYRSDDMDTVKRYLELSLRDALSERASTLD